MSKAPPTNTREQTQATQAVTINSRKKLKKIKTMERKKQLSMVPALAALQMDFMHPCLCLI